MALILVKSADCFAPRADRLHYRNLNTGSCLSEILSPKRMPWTIIRISTPATFNIVVVIALFFCLTND